MKTIKGYEVRFWVGESYSKGAGRKLYSRQRAARIVKVLKKRYGVAAFAVPRTLDATAKVAA